MKKIFVMNCTQKVCNRGVFSHFTGQRSANNLLAYRQQMISENYPAEEVPVKQKFTLTRHMKGTVDLRTDFCTLHRKVKGLDKIKTVMPCKIAGPFSGFGPGFGIIIRYYKIQKLAWNYVRPMLETHALDDRVNVLVM